MHSPLLKKAMETLFGKGKSDSAKRRAAQRERETVYNGATGQKFTTESGATYEVQKNGSFRRIS